MLLGSTSSLGPSARRGVTTLTGTTPASGAVAAATRSVLSRRRGTMPMTSSVTSSATAMRTVQPVLDSGMRRLLCGRSVVTRGVAEKVLARRTPAQNAVDDRNEKERGKGRHGETADDRAAQRRILLTAFAEAQRHREHADDHRERGHEHRAQARGARGQSGAARIAPFQHLVV